LSKLTKVARSKTYEVITRLRRKGLVVKHPPMPSPGVTQRFVAIDPKEVFSQKISEVNKLSDYLCEAFSNPSTPRYPDIHFYTTKDLVKKFLLKTSSSKKSFKFSFIDSNIKDLMGFSFITMIRDIKRKKHEFIISKARSCNPLKEDLNNFFVSDKTGGVSFILTEDSLILDLWKSQHVFLEVRSRDVVKTFIHLFELSKKKI